MIYRIKNLVTAVAIVIVILAFVLPISATISNKAPKEYSVQDEIEITLTPGWVEGAGHDSNGYWLQGSDHEIVGRDHGYIIYRTICGFTFDDINVPYGASISSVSFTLFSPEYINDGGIDLTLRPISREHLPYPNPEEVWIDCGDGESYIAATSINSFQDYTWVFNQYDCFFSDLQTAFNNRDQHVIDFFVGLKSENEGVSNRNIWLHRPGFPPPIYSLTINFHVPSIIHVPEDAPTIQDAIDVSIPGDMILVAPGEYNEHVSVETDDITIMGSGPHLTTIMSNTEYSPTFTITASDVVVSNMKIVIHNSWSASTVVEIYGNNNRIKNTIIAGGVNGDHWGYLLLTEGSGTEIINNILADGEIAIFDPYQDSLTAKNNIVYNNEFDIQYYSENPNTEDIVFRYNDFWNNDESWVLEYPELWTVEGNIEVDPLFVNENFYRLHSRSLCIDAGDPNDDYSNEPRWNGNRINIGAYGNTQWATSYYRIPISFVNKVCG